MRRSGEKNGYTLVKGGEFLALGKGEGGRTCVSRSMTRGS